MVPSFKPPRCVSGDEHPPRSTRSFDCFTNLKSLCQQNLNLPQKLQLQTFLTSTDVSISVAELHSTNTLLVCNYLMVVTSKHGLTTNPQCLSAVSVQSTITQGQTVTTYGRNSLCQQCYSPLKGIVTF